MRVRVEVQVLRLLAALVLALGLSLVARPAQAATDDVIDSFTAASIVNPSGVTHVTETIVYRFGTNSGRHGIDRQYVTREQYNDQQDAEYEYSNFKVSSPSGAPTQFQTSSSTSGRDRKLRLRIGDPDRTISSPTATYVISYDVAGAMRTFSGYDELYWDVTGNIEGTTAIKKADVTVEVPDGAQGVSCFAGPVQSKNPCAEADIRSGVATFAASDLASGEGITIGVKIKPGVVADNAPHLVERGDQLSTGQKQGLGVFAGVTLLSAILAPLIGRRWWLRHGRDERYVGLPPGTVPVGGAAAAVGPSDPDLQIPVAFAPPRIPVAEAGLLVDGQVDTRETTATIIDLAVRGVLRIEAASESDVRATLLDPSRIAAPHETVLLNGLFHGAPPGAVTTLTGRGNLTSAHDAMTRSVQSQVTSRGWFSNLSKSGAALKFSWLPFVVVAFFVFGGPGLLLGLVLLPLVPILVTIGVIRSKLRRGRRTADGRAVCDQVEGFRTYLATAEADQIRFEEGEDIFSRYLPWAIIFDLTDRWTKICQDLIAAGRIPDVTPYWYYGNLHWTMFNYSMMANSLNAASVPMPSTSTSGTGFGGGSSFGGGGFSGGGGGGGGTGSW